MNPLQVVTLLVCTTALAAALGDADDFIQNTSWEINIDSLDLFPSHAGAVVVDAGLAVAGFYEPSGFAAGVALLDPSTGETLDSNLIDMDTDSLRVQGVASDNNGGVYFVGSSFSALVPEAPAHQGDLDIVVWGFDTDSSGLDHAYSFYLGSNTTDWGNAITFDGDSLVLGGSTAGTLGASSAGAQDALVVKTPSRGLDADADWIAQFGTSEADTVNAIAVTEDGTILAVGRTEGTLPGTGNQAYGGGDAFVARIQPDGTVASLTQFGSTQNDKVNAAYYDDGVLYVLGMSAGTVDVDPVSADTNATDLSPYMCKFDVDTDLVDGGSPSECWMWAELTVAVQDRTWVMEATAWVPDLGILAAGTYYEEGDDFGTSAWLMVVDPETGDLVEEGSVSDVDDFFFAAADQPSENGPEFYIGLMGYSRDPESALLAFNTPDPDSAGSMPQPWLGVVAAAAIACLTIAF